MNRTGHENISYFVGPEVEQTPANSKRTLFVVGKQQVDEILKMAETNKVQHIFMGANHSFEVDPADGTLYWNDTIVALLNAGYWVTLDYEAHNHDRVLQILSKEIWQSRTFVPLLSVRIPNVETSSPNLTVKIDDIDFDATNPGVWCMHYHEVTDSNRFTGWNEYSSDEVIGAVVLETQVEVPQPKPTPVAEEAPESNIVQNAVEAGLDTTSLSQLKPEDEEEAKVQTEADEVSEVSAKESNETPNIEAPAGKDTSKKIKSKA